MKSMRRVDKSAKVAIMQEVLTDFSIYAGIGETDLKSMHMAVQIMDRSLDFMVEGEHPNEHPQCGYSLFIGMDGVTDDTARIVLEHHERADGTGYPHGKKDYQVGKLSKIVAICEEYVDMRLHNNKERTIKKLSNKKGYLNESLLTKFLVFLMDYEEPLVLMLSH